MEAATFGTSYLNVGRVTGALKWSPTGTVGSGSSLRSSHPVPLGLRGPLGWWLSVHGLLLSRLPSAGSGRPCLGARSDLSHSGSKARPLARAEGLGNVTEGT